MDTLKLYFAIGISLLILFGAFRFYKDRVALRDDSTLTDNKPYSLARVQLLWWTLVIVISFTLVYGLTGVIWPMNSTCLTLLGISLFTTTSGKLIDNAHIADVSITRHQDIYPSQGLITDILSDEYGLSVHRYQAVILNLVYGGYFLIEVFSKLNLGHFPEFDPPTLALLGVSSSAYLGLKMAEGKGNAPNEASKP
ncbi:hypothetical protein KEF85_06785 [Methylomonas paludis]|uniref:Uncharacterized protein n=1 Tax=Methylomonas paludis TaxID=1173101 RepID=A0A975MQZ6_9GAMM|nr:hypothetical protein [Methylomonas paludis]QWF72149.1 hypothetical protein KEF85_06785 [Methylomonas paludis]